MFRKEKNNINRTKLVILTKKQGKQLKLSIKNEIKVIK